MGSISRTQESWHQERFFKVEETELYFYCDKKAKRRTKSTEKEIQTIFTKWWGKVASLWFKIFLIESSTKSRKTGYIKPSSFCKENWR